MNHLCLHGFAQSPALWNAFDAPWLPGHGLAPVCEGDDFESAVKAFVKNRHPRANGDPVLIGYSMGARVALSIALQGLLPIRHLVLYSVHPGLEEHERPMRRAQEEEWQSWITQGLDVFAQKFGALPVLNQNPPHPDADLWRRSQTQQGLSWALRTLGLAAMPNYWDRLNELTMPVTLVVGEYDIAYRTHAERMLPLLRCGELRVVQGVGHLCV